MSAFATIIINQGADYSQRFRYAVQTDPDQCPNEYTPVDIRTWTARMQIRKTYGAPVIMELSTANGKIFIENDDNGVFGIVLTSSETALLNDSPYQYDLFFTRPDAFLIKALYGAVIVQRRVTI